MSLDRLGGIDLALRTHRFVREDLAIELLASPEFASRFEAVAPVLMMDGGLVRQDATGVVSERVGGVHVFAVDARFSEFGELSKDSLPDGDQLVLSHRVAAQINAKVGDELTLWLELPATIPRDSLLGGSTERTTQEVALTVSRTRPSTTRAWLEVIELGRRRTSMHSCQMFSSVTDQDRDAGGSKSRIKACPSDSRNVPIM